MMRRAVLSWIFASSLMLPAVALAKGEPTAKQAVAEGQKAEKQKKWDEAKSAYEKALELDDKPDTRIRLAEVESKLGHLVEAADHLKKALDAKNLSFMQRTRAKNLLKGLEKRTPTLTFDLPKGFSGTVKIGDREIGASELGAPVPVNPGEHKIHAEAEGMKPYNETVQVAEKDKKNLSILMEPAKEDAPEEAPAEKQAPPKSSGGNKTLAYVALGVGVVGVGVGAFMGLQAKSTKDDIDAKCKNGVCGESERDLYDKGKTQANVSTAGFIVGAVGIGVGTVLLLTGGSGKAEMEGKTQARRATPYVGPGHVGVFGQF